MRENHMIKAFFFDLDGTLVDTHEANYKAYQKAIADVIGAEASESLRGYIREGRSSAEFLPLTLDGVTADEVTKINERKKQTYKEFAGNSVKNEYLVRFLENISQYHTTALITTAKRQNAETILAAHGLQDVFSFCIYGDDVQNMKPHPEAYQVALEKAGVAAHEALVFEDSEKGIRAAEAAGLSVVHVRDFIV